MGPAGPPGLTSSVSAACGIPGVWEGLSTARVGGWRGGKWLAVGSGAPAGVSRRQLSLQPWPVSLPFPAPARQTVHAVVPHTADRRSSPAAFDFPGLKRPGRNDDPIKADQAQMVFRSQYLGHPPTAGSAAFAPFGQPQRKPGQGIVPDLAEHQCGDTEAEITRPSAQEQVEFLHDPLDRYQQTGSSRDRPNPIPCMLEALHEGHRPRNNHQHHPGGQFSPAARGSKFRCRRHRGVRPRTSRLWKPRKSTP